MSVSWHPEDLVLRSKPELIGINLWATGDLVIAESGIALRGESVAIRVTDLGLRIAGEATFLGVLIRCRVGLLLGDRVITRILAIEGLRPR